MGGGRDARDERAQPGHPETTGHAVEEVKAKVVLAGAARVGKTSLIRRYLLNEFDERYRSALGTIIYKRTVDVAVGGRSTRVKMTLWDTLGQPRGASSRPDTDLYGAQGVLAVCDVTNLRTLTPLVQRVDAAFRVAGDIPVQILMNKADLGPRDEARSAGLRTGLHRGVPCYLTSAKEGSNVVPAFEDLARRVAEQSLVPLSGSLDDVDRTIMVHCSKSPLTPKEVAGRERLPEVFAEARIDRLRRRGFLRLWALELDDNGRPRMSYVRTEKVLAERAVAQH